MYSLGIISYCKISDTFSMLSCIIPFCLNDTLIQMFITVTNELGTYLMGVVFIQKSLHGISVIGDLFSLDCKYNNTRAHILFTILFRYLKLLTMLAILFISSTIFFYKQKAINNITYPFKNCLLTMHNH